MKKIIVILGLVVSFASGSLATKLIKDKECTIQNAKFLMDEPFLSYLAPDNKNCTIKGVYIQGSF